MTETRVLRISKDAFKGPKRSSRKVKEQKGGYDNVPGSVIPMASLTPFPSMMKGGDIVPPPMPAEPPLILVSSAATTSANAANVKGGARGLQLAPKKEKLDLVKNTKRPQTRKVVRIQMGNLRKSMKRAKDIVAESKEKPIAEIEGILSSAGIIRQKGGAMSEGRQKTLRGIYRDYLQLRSNAL
jgi:hypothetical protein